MPSPASPSASPSPAEGRAAKAQATAWLAAALDALPAHVCLVDGDGTILWVNRAWRTFAADNGGQRQAVCEGANYFKACEASIAGRDFAARLREVLAGQRDLAEVEYTCHAPAEERWFVATATRLDDGATPRAVLVHHAVTTHKRTDHRLAQAQRLEALGTLAGGVAHDFNNALGAILGSAVLAQEALPAGHEALPPVQQVFRAGLRARGLVQQILAFCSGQTRPRAPRDLVPLVDEAGDLLRPTLPAGVTLTLQLPDVPVVVECDADEMHQVVMNLGVNARHAVEATGGTIELGLRVDDAPHAEGAAGAGRQVHLWVADDGVGMDEATRSRIFDPFFTTRAAGHGTGLGLAVIHGIVERAGGSIEVHSRPGQGSRFDVRLPLSAREADPEHAPVPAPSVTGREGGVLLVDDDETMGLTMEALLSRAGWSVTRVTDPRQALRMLARHPAAFRAIVSDLTMPGLNGLEVARAVHGLVPDLPVILVSGHADPKTRAQAKAAGVHAVLAKEEAFERLEPAVREAAGGRAH